MTQGDACRALVILAAGQAKRYGSLKPLAPVGPNGEAILDLLASDAISAGFETLVIVLNPRTGLEIHDHIESSWPAELDVRYAVQRAPRGTVDAVLSAWPEVTVLSRFAVANADDLYGQDALRILAEHLVSDSDDNALVGFRLERAVIGSSPVTRGVCQTGPGGYLIQIDERRGVTRREDGTFSTGDNRFPDVLDPGTLVSMNLWGFTTAMVEVFEQAMSGAGKGEVLLPELVGQVIAEPDGKRRFKVLPTDSRCVGVTHPGDLELVQEDVLAQIRRGERPSTLWGGR